MSPNNDGHIDDPLKTAGDLLDLTPFESAEKVRIYAPKTFKCIVDYVLREILGEVGDV